jgi:hypothetical protein
MSRVLSSIIRSAREIGSPSVLKSRLSRRIPVISERGSWLAPVSGREARPGRRSASKFSVSSFAPLRIADEDEKCGQFASMISTASLIAVQSGSETGTILLMTTFRASQETDEILTKQIQLLYQHLPIALVATSVNSIILVVVLWSRISHPVLMSWLISSQLTALLRYALVVRYRKSKIPPKNTYWDRRLLLGTIFSAVCWGSAGILMFSAESMPHQAFLAFVLGGMATGAVTTYSVRMRVFLSFALPVLIPIAIRFFVEGDDLHLAMGGMALLFIVLVTDSARRVHTTITKSLRLEAANQNLIQHLTAARDELEHRVQQRTTELREALSEVKVLSGLLPICSNCKKIRDDQGYWNQMEHYIREHSEAEFTHSLCPECAKELFPGFSD